jgi:hypothetical protein
MMKKLRNQSYVPKMGASSQMGAKRGKKCSRVLLEKPPVVYLLKISQHFMEPEGSLRCSQEHE